MTEKPTPESQLEIAIAWGDDAFLRVEHLALSSRFSVGSDDQASFAMPASVLGCAHLDLVAPSADGPVVTVPGGAMLEIVEAHAKRVERVADEGTRLVLRGVDSVTIRHHGFRFRIASVEPEPTPRRFFRHESWLAVVGLAVTLGLLGVVASDARPDPRAIVVTARLDLSHPAVRALIEARRAHPPARPPRAPERPAQVARPRANGVVMTAETPTATEVAASVVVTPTATEVAANEAATLPASTATSAHAVLRPAPPTSSDTSSRPTASARDAQSATTAEAEDPAIATALVAPTIDVEPIPAAPSALGAIRSRVRALDRCFDERRAAADGSPEARARLARCLEEARRAPERPDAIVSFAVEVRDSSGNTDHAFGGRFGIAVTP